MIIHSDPAHRGITSLLSGGQLIGQGQLEAAAVELAEQGELIGIITGFCIIGDDAPTAETDGPPGTLFLARTLLELGHDVTIISDSVAMPLLEAGCDLWGMGREMLVEFPFEPVAADDPRRMSNAPQYNETSDAWVNTFLDGPGGRLTHLISIERCGPSHHQGSIARQANDGQTVLGALLEQFEQQVPCDGRDICHNMQGKPVNGYTAKTHRLFEILAERELPIITMAVGDGGNELGMGRYGWDLLRGALARNMPQMELAGRIPCRISTDLLLVAGVSNWGAYAMAAAVAALRGKRELLDERRIAQQRELIEVMVDQAGAVDGVTGRHTATIDGIELDTSLSVLTDLLALCRGAC